MGGKPAVELLDAIMNQQHPCARGTPFVLGEEGRGGGADSDAFLAYPLPNRQRPDQIQSNQNLTLHKI